MRILNAAEASREALEQLLSSSKDYIVIGEGVPDPRGCFGTTKGLKPKFPDQVFDMPISENGMTGVCIGASLNGLRPIMVHMRQDFLLYAMDQIVNNAAKWYSMFGGQKSVPIVIKAFTGRGWGAGNQHAQNLEALFAHIPGLKVVSVSSAYNAKGLLIAAARDPNPVIFLEHRWIHSTESEVPEEMYEVEIGKSKVVRAGVDVTIVAWGYMVVEAIRAAKFLAAQGISAEVVDVISLRPLDFGPIVESITKTKRLLVVNDDWAMGGIGLQILGALSDHSVKREILNNVPVSVPSSHYLTTGFYPDVEKIFRTAALMCRVKIDPEPVHEYMATLRHDAPDDNFKGPF